MLLTDIGILSGTSGNLQYERSVPAFGLLTNANKGSRLPDLCWNIYFAVGPETRRR